MCSLKVTETVVSSMSLPREPRRIGLMAELTGSSSLAPLIDAAVDRLEAGGFATVVLSSGRSRSDERNAWELMARSRCDGIILHADHLPNEQLARLISTRRNVVLASLNHTRAGILAATHLLAKGHSRLALVSGPVHRFSTRHLIEGFMQKVNSVNSHRAQVQTLESSMDEEGGAIAMNRLLRSRIKPTAIFVGNDLMAMGALRVCRDNGIRVPQDISLLGLGDHHATAHTQPALSTLRLPLNRTGEWAAARIMHLLDGVRDRNTLDTSAPEHQPRIIDRDSVMDLNKPLANGQSPVSERERECLNWAAQGKTSWEISQILGVTESTIIYHLRNATHKLNAANRLHAVAKALKASIIDI